MSNSALKDIGLTEYEGEIYELLLKLGEIPMPRLVKESKLKHSTVYSVIDTLVKKRLVAKKDIKKKLHVKAESPAKLLDIAKNQYVVADSALSSMRNILPLFLSQYINSTLKSAVKVFEGVEGIKQVYQDMINEEKNIYSLLKIGAINKDLLHWINTVFTKKRVAKKIHTKVIVSKDAFTKEYKEKDIKELRTSREISYSSFPLENEINIYGDKVAFIYQSDAYPLLGIVIEHPKFALTCKSWFDLAWVGIEKQN